MIFHPDVLAAHAQFGGDLPSMQALYDHPDHVARIAALEAQLAALTQKDAEPVGYLFRLRYGPDNWSSQDMFSTILPSDPEDVKDVCPLYTSPPTPDPDTEKEALRERVKELEEALDAVFEDTQARTKAGMTYGINGHPTLSPATLHIVQQARFTARRVREGGKVDG